MAFEAQLSHFVLPWIFFRWRVKAAAGAAGAAESNYTLSCRPYCLGHLGTDDNVQALIIARSNYSVNFVE